MGTDAQAAKTDRELKAAADKVLRDKVLLDADKLLGDDPAQLSRALAGAQTGLANAAAFYKMWVAAGKPEDFATLANEVAQTAHTVLDSTLALAERHYKKAVEKGTVELIDDLAGVRHARSKLGTYVGGPLQVFAFVPDTIGLIQAIQKGEGVEAVRKGSSLFSGWVALRAGARGGVVAGLVITAWVELHLHLLSQLGAMLAAIKEREKRKRTADLHKHLLVLASHAGTLAEMYWAESNGKKRVSQEALTKQAQKVSDHLGAVASKTSRLRRMAHKDKLIVHPGLLDQVVHPGLLDQARRNPVLNSHTVKEVMDCAARVIVRRMVELDAIGRAKARYMLDDLFQASSEVTDYTPPPPR